MSKSIKANRRKPSVERKRFNLFGSWSSAGIKRLTELMNKNRYEWLFNKGLIRGIKPWITYLVRPITSVSNLTLAPDGCPRSKTVSKCKNEKQCLVCVYYNGTYIGVNHLLRAKSCIHIKANHNVLSFQRDIEQAAKTHRDWEAFH